MRAMATGGVEELEKPPTSFSEMFGSILAFWLRTDDGRRVETITLVGIVPQ